MSKYKINTYYLLYLPMTAAVTCCWTRFNGYGQYYGSDSGCNDCFPVLLKMYLIQGGGLQLLQSCFQAFIQVQTPVDLRIPHIRLIFNGYIIGPRHLPHNRTQLRAFELIYTIL